MSFPDSAEDSAADHPQGLSSEYRASVDFQGSYRVWPGPGAAPSPSTAPPPASPRCQTAGPALSYAVRRIKAGRARTDGPPPRVAVRLPHRPPPLFGRARRARPARGPANRCRPGPYPVYCTALRTRPSAAGPAHRPVRPHSSGALARCRRHGGPGPGAACPRLAGRRRQMP